EAVVVAAVAKPTHRDRGALRVEVEARERAIGVGDLEADAAEATRSRVVDELGVDGDVLTARRDAGRALDDLGRQMIGTVSTGDLHVTSMGVGGEEQEGEHRRPGGRDLARVRLGDAHALSHSPRMVATSPPRVELEALALELEPARQLADLVVARVVLEHAAPRAIEVVPLLLGRERRRPLELAVHGAVVASDDEPDALPR